MRQGATMAMGAGVAMAVGMILAVWGLTAVLTLISIVLTLLILFSGAALLCRSRAWFAILLVGILVRLPYTVLKPVHDDSSVYVGRALNLLEGQITISGHIGVEAIMALFLGLFGQMGGNLASFVASLATVWLVGRTATVLFDSPRAGHAAGFVLAVTPLHINFSWWAYTEPIAVCFFTLSLYFFVSRRYVAGAAVGIIVFFMRLEYLFLLLAPLAGLYAFSEDRFRHVFVLGPLLGFVGVILLYQLSSGDSPVVTVRTLVSMPSLFSTGFFVGLSNAPLEHTVRNLQFYAPHFLHWGVPYFEFVLVNPLLPVLFLIGVVALLPRVRYARILPVTIAIIIAAAFMYRELTVGTGLIGPSIELVAWLYASIFVALVVLVLQSTDKRLFPLFATIPYLCLLAILYLSPRYLLPMAVVGSLYAGYGLKTILDMVVISSDDTEDAAAT
ncbi:hypothetical protein BVU17_10305 [Haloarcula taiwanensis]|uniref:Uncharacterized protein n=1 Tax=Haloarcula taiwanensis TaxID=1932004 RepID=A0A2H4ZZI3_9EURY|nr:MULTISPECIES: hypothetical protein [Haloarcula]AUG47888.1 hypothetical protein BVU17_10305 [Haloarcula taiwanensis]RLM39197.1 hypothetical protein DVK01_01160 [Haloarcula sp. Atlit-120R]